MTRSWRTKANKPLPLKQRTSSVDARRDYNAQTWYSVLGLLKIREYFITVDHFSIWRRHLAWAMENGKSLRDYMTQRFASSMVFMSLLLSTEVNILFNSSVITTNMRHSLQAEEYWRIEFWIGIVIILSAVLTLLSLISTYTAWSMVNSVHENNAHCIFRSSIGQYVAELPGRLVVFSIYSFLLWIMMFFFVLLPVGYWSIALAAVSFLLFAHTICVFSAFGRIIMHSGGMGHHRVFEQSYEKNLVPHSLHAHLLAKARANLSTETSIKRQYRSNSRPIDHFYSEDELSAYMPGGDLEEADSSSHHHRDSFPYEDNDLYNGRDSSVNFYEDDNFEHPPTTKQRTRTDSIVRFADEVDMVTSSPPKHSTNNNQHHQHNNTMVAVQEVDTPVSQLSTTYSLADNSTDDTSMRTIESSSSKSLAQQQQEIDSTKQPARPGTVRRNRSNTTATDGEFEALLQSRGGRNISPNKKSSPLPPTHHKVEPKRAPNRAESDSVTNAHTHNAWARNSSQQEYSSFPEKRASTGSLPANPSPNAPGLSVLENAAKLQRQWRNSYVERSSNELSASPPPPPRPTSFSERDTSIQQLWVNSSPKIQGKNSSAHHSPSLGSSRKQRRDSFGNTVPSQSPPPPPMPPRSQTSSTDALSSRGSSNTTLSKEEEEAYMADYGSFEQLPPVEDPWKRQNSAGSNTEAASLLDHDGLGQSSNQSYMAVDEPTPKLSNTDPWKKPKPKG